MFAIFLPIHASLMILSFLSMLTGVVISLLFKKKKWRYKTHKRLGITAGLCGSMAFIAGVLMVQSMGGGHFQSIHALVGLTTVILLILTPSLGLAMKKIKNKKMAKLLHKTAGYLTLSFMAFTLFLGLRFVFP